MATKPISIRIPKELEIEVKKFKPSHVSYSAFIVDLIIRGLEAEKSKQENSLSKIEQLDQRIERLEKRTILSKLEELNQRIERLEKIYN